MDMSGENSLTVSLVLLPQLTFLLHRMEPNVFLSAVRSRRRERYGESKYGNLKTQPPGLQDPIRPTEMMVPTLSLVATEFRISNPSEVGTAMQYKKRAYKALRSTHEAHRHMLSM